MFGGHVAGVDQFAGAVDERAGAVAGGGQSDDSRETTTERFVVHFQPARDVMQIGGGGQVGFEQGAGAGCPTQIVVGDGGFRPADENLGEYLLEAGDFEQGGGPAGLA